jgi:cation:H+ antiporter
VNPPEETTNLQDEKDRERFTELTDRAVYFGFAGAAVAVLVAGAVLAHAADAISAQTGLASTFVGATVLAFVTSMPELSTTIQAARLGAHGMAISSIFGSSAMNIALLFPADVVYREAPILAASGTENAFTAALGILLTCVYLGGLLHRENRAVWRFGWDSGAVAGLYVLGMWMLFRLD